MTANAARAYRDKGGRPVTHPERRNALLGKVHIAKKDLGLRDEDYRAILNRMFQVDSAADLRIGQLGDLLEEMKRLGWVPPKKLSKARKADGHRPQPDDGESKKMLALWLSLYDLGAVRDPSDRALSLFAKRVTGGKSKGGVDALPWLRGEQRVKVIEALKAWAVRAGESWEPFVPGVVGHDGLPYQIRPSLRVGLTVDHPALAIVVAQWRILGRIAAEAGRQPFPGAELLAIYHQLTGDADLRDLVQAPAERLHIVQAELGRWIREGQTP